MYDIELLRARDVVAAGEAGNNNEYGSTIASERRRVPISISPAAIIFTKNCRDWKFYASLLYLSRPNEGMTIINLTVDNKIERFARDASLPCSSSISSADNFYCRISVDLSILIRTISISTIFIDLIKALIIKVCQLLLAWQ